MYGLSTEFRPLLEILERNADVVVVATVLNNAGELSGHFATAILFKSIRNFPSEPSYFVSFVHLNASPPF